MAANVKAFMSGGHECTLNNNASVPPACINALLAVVAVNQG